MGMLIECYVNPLVIGIISGVYKNFLMYVHLLYLVLVVIKSPTYGVLGRRSLKYRGLR